MRCAVLALVLAFLGTAGICPIYPTVAAAEERLFGTPLSAEADAWLTAANVEFNEKQQRFHREWLSDTTGWGMNLDQGWAKFTRPKGDVCFDAAAIGSARDRDGTWEWAWYNPNLAGTSRVDGAKLQEIGRRFDLRYLERGMFTMPADPEVRKTFPQYLSGIALKALDGYAMYGASSQGTRFFLLLTNPRPCA